MVQGAAGAGELSAREAYVAQCRAVGARPQPAVAAQLPHIPGTPFEGLSLDVSRLYLGVNGLNALLCGAAAGGSSLRRIDLRDAEVHNENIPYLCDLCVARPIEDLDLSGNSDLSRPAWAALLALVGDSGWGVSPWQPERGPGGAPAVASSLSALRLLRTRCPRAVQIRLRRAMWALDEGRDTGVTLEVSPLEPDGRRAR
eukprot:TRINITY_DN34952_c0_g1_i1.p1 TRINITY_DN34952_c0_g1~~TRINITY_DN34952_c0_g1_i1.p1  ORF type:complete len:222 (+),score=61.51 TRINITY_DN34952_c0_g1_i1:68-667(+)